MVQLQSLEVKGSQLIVIGFDGSKDNRKALCFAVGVAQVLGLSIRLVGAYPAPPWDNSSARASTVAALKKAASEVTTAGVSVEWLTVPGDLAETLVQESEQASLLVVDSHDRGGFANRLLGGGSRTLPYRAACPTAVVPDGWDPDGKKIATFNSPNPVCSSTLSHTEYFYSERSVARVNFQASIVVGVDMLGMESPALWAAARFAESRGVALHIVGVVRAMTGGPEWMPSTRDMKRLVKEETERLLAANAAVTQKHPELTVKWTLFLGDPVEVLLNASETADTVVIGTRPRFQLCRVLFGSVSEALLARMACPTIFIRVSRDLY